MPDCSVHLELPQLNPYIPDDFTLYKPEKQYEQPELLIHEPDLRVVYMPSRYLGNEPKADVTLVLRRLLSSSSAIPAR